jgi:predicted nucleic acid-binding protein
MRLYVETNFILELAFVQGEHESCDRILAHCEAGHAALTIPSACLAEPYETLIRRKKKRSRIKSVIEKQLRELRRSEPYKDEIDALRPVMGLLIRSAEEDDERLTAVLERVSRIATLLPLEADVVSRVRSCRETYNLKPQDSIVYLSVLRHLESAGGVESCFINRDRDFDDPDIVATLTRLGCKRLLSFGEGYGYLKNRGATRRDK